MGTFYTCERCEKVLDQYYTIQIEEKYRILCNRCVDEYKVLMANFWDNKEPMGRVDHLPKEYPTLPKSYPNREKIGSDFDAMFPKGFTYEHIPKISTGLKPESRPIEPEDLRPRNRILKIVDKLFYKVEKSDV